MNILLSAYNCRPNTGSESAIGWNWAFNLSLMGHNVWVLTAAGNREDIEAETKRTPLRNVTFVFVGVPEWTFKIRAGGMHFRYLLWLRSAYRQAKELERTIDIAWHISWNTIEAGSLLWKLSKPFFLGPVGGGQKAPRAFKEYFGGRWWSERLRNLRVGCLTRSNPMAVGAVRHARRVFASNSDTRDLAMSLGCSHAELVWEAALPSSFIPLRLPERVHADHLRLLWVGGLIPRKAVRLALEAIAVAKVPCRLTIVGDGPQGKELPGWLDQYGLKDRVGWWGRVPWLEVKRAYLENDVLMLTSLRDTSGAQFLEAMAHGMPVIALDHHGAHDWIPENAGIKVPVTVPKETIAGLAAAIEKLYREPDLRKKMGENAYAYAKEQTWENRVREMAKLYERHI